MSAKASGAQPNGAPNGDAKNRHQHHDGSSTRAYTIEQKAAVLRIKRCGHTEFYKILDLEEVKDTVTDGQIKKQYRKLSLLTHPDKNGYEGADEAFKMVSRAFQILSDADKKRRYDQTGGDPDSRFSSASAGASNPFSGFSAQRAGGGRAGGPMFEEEMSPEELFRQFFGGGGMFGGGPFGGGGFGGPGFAFQTGGLGGPGIRIHQFGGNAPRRRPHNHADAQPTSPLAALQGLLPLLILFILPLLSSLFSGPSGPTGPTPYFDNGRPHTHEHISKGLKIQYFVNPQEVAEFSQKDWRRLDNAAETQYVHKLSTQCQRESQIRMRMFDQAQGFFFTDQALLGQARAYPTPSCDWLTSNGINMRY